MATYIDTNIAKVILCEHCNACCSEEPCEPSECEWLQRIDEATSSCGKYVVCAHWVWNGKHWECSNCRNERLHDLVLGLDASHCPYCGAQMLN